MPLPFTTRAPLIVGHGALDQLNAGVDQPGRKFSGVQPSTPL
jgi:hypothetical protein